MRLKFLFPILCIVLLFSFEIDGQVKKTKLAKKGQTTNEKELVELKRQILAQIEKENEENKPSKVFVFVGEKVEVKEFQLELTLGEPPFNHAYKAKYKIIQNVYGDYQGELIEFEAFDHYGYPAFAEFKNVLLFVSEYKGKLYHEKYQYFDVYQTKNGKWAGCGDPYQFEEFHRKPVKTFNLEFNEPVIYDLSRFNAKQRKEFYPLPFFRIEGNKAVCLRGAYIDELFQVKRNGVLKARKVF
ncbi:MAG: hypothetical protein K1X72_03160 [Pyrinomonadaceae bacterium]|nr:hypothetical protein [Pyrinomonadaceae bacterium]